MDVHTCKQGFSHLVLTAKCKLYTEGKALSNSCNELHEIFETFLKTHLPYNFALLLT